MKMDREAAEQYVKGQLESYLQGKGINTRRPFRCLNPAHNDKSPSMSIDRKSPSGLHCHCFACGAYYSTFDLIGIDYNLTDKTAIFNKAYELFGLEIDHHSSGSTTQGNYREPGSQGTENQNQPKTEQNTHNTVHNTGYTTSHAIEDLQDEATIDFTDIVKAAHKELLGNQKALQYLQSRGLSMETIKAYELGYDAGGYNHLLKAHPENQSKSKKAGLYRYIFPYPDAEGRYSYFLTEIEDRTQIDEYNRKYKKISKIAAQLFNERYIQNPPPVVFICEGVYDALSVEEAGGKAIAFVGTAHRRFLSLCKNPPPFQLPGAGALG